MKSFSSLVIYGFGLAPIAAASIYISDTAATQVTSSLQQVINLLQTLNRSFL